MDAFSKYNSNRLYEENVLNEQFYPYIFDGWRAGKTYGLVDNNGYALIPKQNSLRTYTNDNGIFQQNLAFVVPAFNDLKKYYLSLSFSNKFDKNASLYLGINPTSTTQAVDDSYVPHVRKLYDIFYSTSLSEDQREKVDNIDKFMKEFINFLVVSSPKIPLTRSSYIESRWSPLAINGLTLTIAQTGDVSNAQAKLDTYINDPNFNTFLDAAKRYGFMVDKHAPWRIVADIGSPVMADYYKRYGLKNANDVLNKFYHKAHESDIETLKNVLLSFWNSFVSTDLLSLNPNEADRCDSLFTAFSTRSKMQMANFTQAYNDQWFLRFYIYVKILEMGLPVNQTKFEAMYIESLKLYKYVDLNAATDYITKQLVMLRAAKPQASTHLTDLQELITLLSQQREKLPKSGIIF